MQNTKPQMGSISVKYLVDKYMPREKASYWDNSFSTRWTLWYSSWILCFDYSKETEERFLEIKIKKASTVEQLYCIYHLRRYMKEWPIEIMDKWDLESIF